MNDFSVIAEEFRARVDRIVWCTVATVDTAGNPRTRVLHPIWEERIGWVATGRNTLKTKHLAANPNVSLLYWDPRHEVVAVEGTVTWADDASTKQRIWELLRTTPEPVGYDPILFWKGGPSDPTFGVLRVDPVRITLSDLTGAAPTVWHAEAP